MKQYLLLGAASFVLCALLFSSRALSQGTLRDQVNKKGHGETATFGNVFRRGSHSFSDLIRDTQIIAMGKITEAHSRVTPDEESVVTHYRFQVYRTIKEQNHRVNVNDIIEFTGPGGKSSLQGAPVRTTPGDFPLLFPGATYVLMFSPIPSSPRYHVEGAEFGVYKIEDDNSVHCAYGRGLKGTPCDKSLQEFVQSIEQLVR